MFLNSDSKGQCAFEGDVIIEDLATTSIPIFISGATNNDLSTNNCLEAITIHFKHEFIGDMKMELVSPDGDKVTIIGPTATLSGNTSSVFGWDIQFFAESLPPSPDVPYSATWNNLQTWVGLTTYVGKYHPHMGQLEDFDSGTVNGTWTLNIIDEVLFGSGHIYCLDLIFCNDDGINQATCSLVGHTLENETVEACEGDPNLDLLVDPELVQNYDPSIYDYNYLLFNEDKFVTVLPDQNLISYEPGTYTMCGILFFLDELSVLNDIPENSSKSEVETFIEDNGICASLSQDCIDIVILPVPEVLTEEMAICFGEIVTINGVDYNETGIYDILTNQLPCDSMSMLDLTVIELEVNTNAENQALSCSSPTTKLDGNMTDIPLGAQISWRTEDGNITTKLDSTVIEIDRPGTYTFEVSVQGCIFSQDIEIGEEDDYVYVDVSTNILTCSLDSTFIDLTVSDTIDSISWSGPFAFSTLNEDIRVGSGGIYTATFITTLDCEVTQEVEVIEDRIFPDLTISGDTLSCTNEEVTLSTASMDTLGSAFQWFDDNGNISTDTFLVVNEPGLYSLEVITELGCSRIFGYEVISEKEIIEVELISDTISCNNSSVTIAYTSESAGLDVIWELPNQDLVIDSVFSSSQEGTYSLSLNDSKGCTLDTFLVVNRDIEIPELSIFDASFLCGDDSIQLVAQTNFEELSYQWTKPDGNTDNSVSPFIFSPGTYLLSVCRPNGCCATDSVVVGIDNSLPSISFDYEDLNCNNDTIYIVPSDTSTYELTWKRNDVDLVVDSNIIQVTEPGFYEVEVSNEANGCMSLYSFSIISDFANELNSLTAETLNCVKTEAQISLTTENNTVDTYSWSGTELLDDNLLPMVGSPGEYIIDFTFTNGCSGSDTIEVVQEGEHPNLQSENQSITCNIEDVTLSVEYSSNDISVVWSGPDGYQRLGASVQASDPGIYTAIGIASGSCTDTIEVEVLADTIPPAVSIFVDGEITCADSVVLVTALIDSNTDFYEVLGSEVVDSSDLIFEVTAPATYFIHAIGFNGCEIFESVKVRQSTEFPDYTINLDSINCDDNSVNVGFDSSDPNLTVSWDGPIGIVDDQYTFNTNRAGSYSFMITNENGCFLEDSFFVVMDTFPPNSEILLSSQINCASETATLSISNYSEDLSVEWSGPGVLFPNVPQFTTSVVGLYTLNLEARNGCTTTDEITVEYDTLPPEIVVLGDPINCSAGKTFLRVDSDLPIVTYDWDGPDGFESEAAEPLIFAEGIYEVLVTSPNGCQSIGSISVEDERVFPEIEVGDFYLPCDGSCELVFTTFMSEGSFVRWFGPNNYFAQSDTACVFEEGEYIGIAFNEEGCTKSDTFQVINDPVYPEFSGFSELLLCQGPIPITAVDIDDDRSVRWNGPNGYSSEDNPALTEEPGIYQLIVTGDNGCVDSMAIEVVDGRIFPNAEASLDGPFQCLNLEVFLSGEGSSEGNIYTSQWTTEDGNIVQGANTLRPKINQEGIYVLEIKDTNVGCSSFDTLVVQLEEQSLQGAEMELIPPTCKDFDNAEIDIIEFNGGFAPYTIFVDGFDYGERTNIPYLTSGEHLVTIVDSLGCEHDSLVMILEDGVLTVELPPDTTLCFGDSLLIQPLISLSSDSIASILWSSNVSCDTCREVIVKLNEDINVTIEVTDINGCIVMDEFNIKVERPNILPFPQIFSPNGDNINDIFYLPMTKGILEISYIKIYDNWGGLLFNQSSHSPGDESKGWNGAIDGKNAEIGVYIVEAVVLLSDGSQVVYVGDLTLIR